MVSTIAEWHTACRARFQKICDLIRGGDPSHYDEMALASFLDDFGRFNIWAGNIGAHQVGRASLDSRLAEASHIKLQVMKLLQYLSETLEEGEYHLRL